jgi:hypothetical protein
VLLNLSASLSFLGELFVLSFGHLYFYKSFESGI